MKRAGMCVVLALGTFSTGCPSKGERVQANEDPGIGNGGRESHIGQALVSLLRARSLGGADVDTAVVEVLRLQCVGAVLPVGVTVRREDIPRFLPTVPLEKVNTAYCGVYLLNGGKWDVAPAFKDIVKFP